MRHGVSGRKLGRTSSHRKAMLGNMVASLLEHERIHTTVPKAKEARKMAEKLITLGKKGGLHNVRLAERSLKNRVLLQKLFGELKDRYADRKGGYTRIIRTGFRQGDAAETAFLELVDRPEAKPGAEAPAEGEAEAAPKKGKKAKAEAAE